MCLIIHDSTCFNCFCLQAHVNGILSFDVNLNVHYRDIALSTSLNSAAVAVFYHDADLRGTGMVYHLESTNHTSYARANELIRLGFMDAGDFQTRKMIVTTYYKVGHFYRGTELVSGRGLSDCSRIGEEGVGSGIVDEEEYHMRCSCLSGVHSRSKALVCVNSPKYAGA